MPHIPKNFMAAFNFSSSASRRLASGLRINGRAPVQPYSYAGPSAAIDNSPSKSEKSGQAAPAPATGRIADKFSLEMLDRLQAANKNNPQAAALLAENLTATAKEIKTRFGQEKANAFMAEILQSTERSVSSNNLAGAISNFFKNLLNEYDRLSLKKENESPDKSLKEAQGIIAIHGLPDEVQVMSAILNDGAYDILAGKTFEEEKLGSGLSCALYYYFDFDEKHKTMPPDKRSMKLFDMQFNYEPSCSVIKINSGKNALVDRIAASETIKDTAVYLTDVIGNKNAGDYLLNSLISGDVMENIATSIAIVMQENGWKTAEKYVDYLNSRVAKTISASNECLDLKDWHLFSPPEDIAAERKLELEKSGFLASEFWGRKMDLWLMGDEAAIIEEKKHQGLLTTWTDRESKVGSGVEVDLNDLYSNYLKKNLSPAPTGIGSLIDDFI